MRNYIVASWNDADQYDYSGEQIGNRQSKSQRVHFNPDGSACVASYADPEVKSKVSIQDRILPQGKRLTTLREQMLELENSYRSGDMSIQDYSILRDIIVVKIERQEVLYKRAINKRPIRDEIEDEYPQDSAETHYTINDLYQDNDGDREETFAWLSSTNCFKKILQNTCKAAKGVVHFSQKARNYIKSLSEV